MPRRVSCPWFVGRTAELGTLTAALDEVLGGACRTVLIGGDAGIGKSRLASEVGARATTAGAEVLVGACMDLADGGAPYAAINEVLARLGRSVSSQGGAPSDELLDAIRQLTAERPVVLVLEDVHWSDRSTQDLLVRLARGPAVPRLLVLATYRSDDALPRGHPLRRTLAELDRSDRVERVRLDGLGPADLLAQLEGIFDGRPDEDTVRAVLERSDGSPLLAEELAAAASSGGQVSIGLHELLLSRFDRLSPPTQDVLRVAAVGGRRVGHRLLAAVVEASEQELTAALREAVSSHILLVDGDHYLFRHALLHSAIADDALPGERARLHDAFATAIERGPALVDGERHAALVHHWSGAGRAGAGAARRCRGGRRAPRRRTPGRRHSDSGRSPSPRGTTRSVSSAPTRYRSPTMSCCTGPPTTPAGPATSSAPPSSSRSPSHPSIHAPSDPVPRCSTSAVAGACSRPDASATHWRPTSTPSSWCRCARRPWPAPGYWRPTPTPSTAPVTRPQPRPPDGRSPLLSPPARRPTRVTPATPSAPACSAAAIMTGGSSSSALALDLAEAGGDVADAVGVHRHLWRELVSAGRPGELVERAQVGADDARARSMPVLAGVLDGLAAGYCHELGRWDEAEALLARIEPTGLPGIVRLLVGGLLDVDRGRLDVAGDALETVRGLTYGLRDGRVDGLLHRGLAERALWRDRPAEAVAIVDAGLERTTDVELAAWLTLVGLRAASDGDADGLRATGLPALARRAGRGRARGRRHRRHGGGRGITCGRLQQSGGVGDGISPLARDRLPAAARAHELAPCRGGARRR